MTCTRSGWICGRYPASARPGFWMRGIVTPLPSPLSPAINVSLHAVPRVCRSSPIVTMTPNLVLLVLFFDDREELFGRPAGGEPVAERLVLEQARDARERLQVSPRGILRRDEEEKEVRRLAVERVEIDAR